MDIVGRDVELETINAWLKGGVGSRPPRSSAATVLVIEGEPGSGKTTVWAEAIERASVEGRNVLAGRPTCRGFTKSWASTHGLSWAG